MLRVLKGAGLKLFLVVDNDHRVLVVVIMLEAVSTAPVRLADAIKTEGDFGGFLQPQRGNRL
jgi:hypothetical protein